MYKHHPDEHWDEMVRAYLGGKSMRKAVEGFGASKNGLRGRLLALGVPLRGAFDRTYRATIDETRFAEVTDEESAYWLGVLFTDGYVITKSNIIGLALSASDRALVERFADFLGYAPGPRLRPYSAGGLVRKTGHRCELVVKSQTVVGNLARLGMHDRKTWTVKPWGGPDHLLKHFWRGAMDGDGSISWAGNGNAAMEFCGNEAMVTGFAAFVGRQTGSAGSVRSKLAVGSEAKRLGLRNYQVRWHGNQVCKTIATLLYDGTAISLARKQEVADRLIAHKPAYWLRHITREEVAALYRTHGTWESAARAVGCKRERLTYHVRKFGLSRRTGKP